MRFLWIFLLAGKVGLPVFSADETTEESHLVYYSPSESFSFDWESRVGWTYFIQQSQDLLNFTYIPVIEPGTGEEISWGFSFVLPESGDAVFMRLRMTDFPMDNVWQDDADGDGFGNQLELDLGTDPLDFTDLDANGIPDDIDAVWAGVPGNWKEAIVDSSNANIYDPDGIIQSTADLLPNGDYDGDGVSNLEEWLNGTAADDYFNGVAPQIFVMTGNYQRALAEEVNRFPLVVLVLDENNEKLTNAPVVYSVDSGDGALAKNTATSATDSVQVVRTFSTSRTPRIFFKQPSTAPVATTVTATAGSSSVTFEFLSLSQASTGAPVPSGNKETIYNPDGSVTFTWEDLSDNEHYSNIYVEDAQGRTWAAGVAPENAESFTVPAAVMNSLP